MTYVISLDKLLTTDSTGIFGRKQLENDLQVHSGNTQAPVQKQAGYNS